MPIMEFEVDVEITLCQLKHQGNKISEKVQVPTNAGMVGFQSTL